MQLDAHCAAALIFFFQHEHFEAAAIRSPLHDLRWAID